jgi:uncharacterized lipoprotein NlpE involved in copper resistance
MTLMTRNRFLFAALLVTTLMGCDSQSDRASKMGYRAEAMTSAADSNVAAAPESAMNKNKYLAYEHFITIDLSENQLEATHQKLIAACNNDKQNNCTVLESNINAGDYPSANIRLRVNPEGVKPLTALVTQSGNITTQSTRVEDLASPIIDSEKRIAMLTAHRDRLLALEEKAAKDIDALIKVSQELANTQASLEDITGQNQYLMQRVKMEIMNIQLVVENRLSFWKPIKQALDNFSNQLAYGVANVIRTVANFLPWLIVLLLGAAIIRFIRKGKNR